MAKSENQKLKLLYLYKILSEKTDDEHFMSMQDIIDALAKYDIKAERKSIYDDIRLLSDYGLEIEGESVGRGYKYHVVGRQFELPELKLLVDAIQSSKFITEKKSRELIKKVETLTSEYEARKLSRQVYVQGRIKTMNESIYYSVDGIHTAIAENKRIKFQYYSWNVKKEMELKHDGRFYEISPYGLSWDDENYYLIGFDASENKVKHFRVDKMLRISVVDKEREGKDILGTKNDGYLDMAEYSRRSFGMFGGQKQNVTIEFDNGLVGIFIDRFGKDISIRPVSDGRSKISVDVDVSNQFFGWITGLGTGVKITAPDNVVKDLKGFIKDISKNY